MRKDLFLNSMLLRSQLNLEANKDYYAKNEEEKRKKTIA